MNQIRQLANSPGYRIFGHYGQTADECPILAMRRVHRVGGRGIEGDRFFIRTPDFETQITFFASGEYESLCD